MEKYPFLETTAFIVIGLLGLKLSASLVSHFMPGSRLSEVVDGEASDLFFSIFTVGIFVVPLVMSYYFDVPHRAAPKQEDED